MCSRPGESGRDYPLRPRIIRNVVLASGITAFVTLVLIFIVSWYYLVGDVEDQLEDLARDLKEEYARQGGNTPKFQNLMDDFADEFSVPMMFVILTTSDGKLIRSTSVAEDMRTRVLNTIVESGEDSDRVSAAHTSLHSRVVAVRFQTTPLFDGNKITVAIDVTAMEGYLLFLVITLSVAFVLMVGGAGLMAGSFATRLTHWLNRVVGTASSIERGDWGRRVEDEGVRVHEVRTLIHAFNAMCDKNEQTLAELRVLTDNIAHDLRTPLTRLGMAAESDAVGCLSGEPLSDVVQEETSSMLEMINTMLEISQTDAKINRTPHVTLDLVETVRAAADLYQPLAEQDGIELKVVLPEAAVPFSGHKGKVQQLCGNLIENAIKYTPKGGRIEVSLENGRESAVLRVADTGCGIAESDLPFVFKRFWRADSSRTLPGNGLGLALVKAIVTSYGGSIECESTLGKGSVFTITLPRLPPTQS